MRIVKSPARQIQFSKLLVGLHWQLPVQDHQQLAGLDSMNRHQAANSGTACRSMSY